MRKPTVPLGLLNRSRASKLAFTIIASVQDEPLEYAAAALGIVLETLATEKNLSPSEIMTAANNMIRETGLEDDQYVQAVRDFIREEIT